MKSILIGIIFMTVPSLAAGPNVMLPNPIPKELMYDSLPVGGYIASIDTPTYGNTVTKRILVNFGNMGGRYAVLFENRYLLLDRKITVSEVKTCEFKKDNGKMAKCVGEATCGLTQCDIKVITGKTRKEYRLILLHEYMHCMGYKDIEDKKYKNDLMYYSENKVYEKNIKEYAKKAHERQPVWKSLKN